MRIRSCSGHDRVRRSVYEKNSYGRLNNWRNEISVELHRFTYGSPLTLSIGKSTIKHIEYVTEDGSVEEETSFTDFGFCTRSEIEYALATGKPERYLEEV